MLLLVCGWPACGKSYFGEWLAANRGFRHFDVGPLPGEPDPLMAVWDKHMPDDPAKFVAALTKKHADCVVTWGSTPHSIPHLEALRTAGFEGWFLLPGNEQRLRQEWMLRAKETNPDVRPGSWEKQRDAIKKGARDLRRFFRDRCIETINSHGERPPCEDLAARMGVPTTPAAAGGRPRAKRASPSDSAPA